MVQVMVALGGVGVEDDIAEKIGFTTLIGSVVVAVFPEPSLDTAVSVYALLVVAVVSQVVENCVLLEVTWLPI